MFRSKAGSNWGSLDKPLCLVALVLWTTLIAGCSPDERSRPNDAAPVILTIGVPLVAGEDPLRGIRQASRLISFEGLVRTSRDGQPLSRLAEGWSVSSDGLSWRFKLRTNAFFHDGSPVDSIAVKASLERSLRGNDIVQYPGLADILSIEAAGPHEFVIRLRERSSFLLDDLGVAIIKVREGMDPVGTGPYSTTSVAANELVMASHKKYWRGSPQIEQVVWKAYPAVRTAWAAMMRGEIDFLYEVGPEAVEFLQGESAVNLRPFLRPYLLGILLNSSAPQLADNRVRRALNYAIDRRLITERALRTYGRPATNAAWPEHWAYDPSIPELVHDPSRAAALLKEAKLPPSATRTPAALQARLEFTCLIPENFELWERLALHSQRHLSEVGVAMRLEKVSVNEFNRRIGSRQFDAVLTEFVVGNSSSRPFTFWHSTSKSNIWGYKNAEMDAALDDIRRATNDREYRDAFRRFQIVSVDDPPAIFLAFGQTTRAVSNRFEVVAPPNSDIVPTIADWRLADPRDRIIN